MKNLILALITFTFSIPAFAGESEFSCRNRMYRDSSLSFNQGEVAVQDSYPRGGQEVARILERELNLKGKLIVNTIALAVQRGSGVQCDSAPSFLVACRGRAIRANLTVKGWIDADGVAGTVSLDVPVELKSFRLQSILASNGPISIGRSEPVEVRLDRLDLSAAANMIIGGQEADLEWNTFFYAREGKREWSFCQKH